MTLTYTGPEGWGQKAYDGDAGIDIPIVEQKMLAPGEFADLPSGIKVAIPTGFYGRIVARSSALRKRKVRVYEGIIDAGFRGELFTYVENIDRLATLLQPGDRLAQLIVQPVVSVPVLRVDQLEPSDRGEKGFGSSDKPTNPLAPLAGQSWTRSAIPPWASDDDGDHSAFTHRDGPRRTLYVGGPIDHASNDPWWKGPNGEAVMNQLPDGWAVYDPHANNQGQHDPSAIWTRNMDALRLADLALFCFVEGAGVYGFGSPIEVYERAMWSQTTAHGLPTIVYVEGHSPGVYLRKLWQDHGVIVTDNWRDTMQLLGEETARID